MQAANQLRHRQASGLVVPVLLAALAGVLSPLAHADCFTEAGRAYDLDPDLLRAVARTESGGRPDAVNRSHQQRTGTIDIGLMQINSGWLKRLAAHGIGEAQLREPCTNVAVGAWILANEVARRGNSWEAVGAYNAACVQLQGDDCRRARSAYAWRVYRHLQAGEGARKPTTAAAVHQRPAAPPGLLSLAQAQGVPAPRAPLETAP